MYFIPPGKEEQIPRGQGRSRPNYASDRREVDIETTRSAMTNTELICTSIAVLSSREVGGRQGRIGVARSDGDNDLRYTWRWKLK